MSYWRLMSLEGSNVLYPAKCTFCDVFISGGGGQSTSHVSMCEFFVLQTASK